MFPKIFALMQLRRSTAFLLAAGNERLLDDIGLTRFDLEALRRGAFAPSSPAKAIPAAPLIPVRGRA